MKKQNFLLLVCMVSVILIFIKEVKAEINDNEIVQMTEIAKQQNIKINKWSMFIKEPIATYNSLSVINKKIKEVKTEEKGYTWTKAQFKEDHYKIIGERIRPLLNIEEKILIIYFPMSEKYNLSITYDVKGSEWNIENWSKISNLYKSKLEEFSAFYTVEGTTSIDKPLYIEATNLLTNFSGKTVQSLNEENFVSLSAYTPHWNSKLPLGKNQYMNLQIAYRNSNDSNNTKVTIGTPIITSEY